MLSNMSIGGRRGGEGRCGSDGGRWRNFGALSTTGLTGAFDHKCLTTITVKRPTLLCSLTCSPSFVLFLLVCPILTVSDGERSLCLRYKAPRRVPSSHRLTADEGTGTRGTVSSPSVAICLQPEGKWNTVSK